MSKKRTAKHERPTTKPRRPPELTEPSLASFQKIYEILEDIEARNGSPTMYIDN